MNIVCILIGWLTTTLLSFYHSKFILSAFNQDRIYFLLIIIPKIYQVFFIELSMHDARRKWTNSPLAGVPWIT